MIHTRAVAVAAATVLAVAMIGRLRRTWVVITVDGASMEPTYHHGDRVAVRRSAPAALSTGDVVIVRQPGPDAGGWMIKRVAAVAGDPVPAGIPEHDELVPDGKLVLLGDNAAQSFDSRVLGYFPAVGLLGGVVRRMNH